MFMSGKIYGNLTDQSGHPVVHGLVNLLGEDAKTLLQSVLTDKEGRFEFRDPPEGALNVSGTAFSVVSEPAQVKGGESIPLTLPFILSISLKMPTGKCDGPLEPCNHAIAGNRIFACADNGTLDGAPSNATFMDYEFTAFPDGTMLKTGPKTSHEVEISFVEPGPKRIEVKAFGTAASSGVSAPGTTLERSTSRYTPYVLSSLDTYASLPDRTMIGGQLGVRLERTRVYPTRDQALWIAIRNRTRAIGFDRYRHFIDRVLGADEREALDNPRLSRKLKELGTNLHGVGAYDTLKVATEMFLLFQCGIRIDDDYRERNKLFLPEFESARMGEPMTVEYAQAKLKAYLGTPPQLPYITEVINTSFPEWQEGFVSCDRVLTGRVNEPCLIELIWSYWHEEGMLVQTMNAITRRFQNVRAPGDRDPLTHLEIDPLRPLNNIVWGNIQDEFRHLSVKRRAYEYEHEYGLSLYGTAARAMRPADSRSKFLEGFHNLLYLCSVFFKEDNDTTVIADGYPLLNALKEVNLLLAQGAHNQYGDLPWTARTEMLLQQWMLARPEIRDFLQSRAMVPYKEAWMPQVDTMKAMQGWSDVTVTHFRDLGVYGEQILLSVRLGNWVVINEEDSAKNWARYWRPEIQGYLHAYRAATGIDLTNSDTVDSTVPAVLLQKRLMLQQQRAR
jgi:hypothetical protein